MLIGPHCGKLDDLNMQRPIAKMNDWGCFQTHFGGPQTYDIPANIRVTSYEDENLTPHWSWHAAFTASANPSERSREGCANYIRSVFYYARKYHIHSVVLHTGAVSGKPIENVLAGMEDFFENYGVRKIIERGETKLAVEMSACVCGLSLYPEDFAERYAGSKIGYCIDLAHTHASGLGWAKLRRIIDQYPPVICHSNYPGSAFGSSRDVHGWRTRPELEAFKRTIITRPNLDLTKEYDETIRLLVSKNVPLIVEGSGFPGGNTDSEITFLRTLV